jgi:hypothetical protein
MRPPNWFLLVIAACAVVLTVATVYHLRYRTVSDWGVYDSWRSRTCIPDTCLRIGPQGPVMDTTDNPFLDLIPRQRPSGSLYHQYLREKADSVKKAKTKKSTPP